MFNVFAKILEPKRIMALQNLQYQEKLLLSDTVPAGQSQMARLDISSLGHFFCQFMTGHFQTLSLDQAVIVDDGVSHLRAKLSDETGTRPLFNTHIPMDLWLSPGRTKSTASTTLLTTDAPSNNLFYPQPFQYMFTVNSGILLDVINDSDVDLLYEIAFHGIRLPVASRERAKKAEARRKQRVA